MSIEQVTGELQQFLSRVYVRYFESWSGLPFAEIPAEKKGTLGLIVGGFSPGAFLSEVWETMVPWLEAPRRVYGPGEFGTAWFAASDPIHRYIKGIDANLARELSAYIAALLNRALTDDEERAVSAIFDRYAYRARVDGMPIQAGIDYVRYLVNLVIGHYRFAATHAIVGGKAKVGVVTYRQEAFQLLE